MWWLLRRPDTLSAERQAVLERMQQASPAFGRLYRLTVQFTEMLRKRQVEQLRPWLEAAQASELRELKSLADGIERDYAAVEAALRLPYSSGPVEGNINRLKLIKRNYNARAVYWLAHLDHWLERRVRGRLLRRHFPGTVSLRECTAAASRCFCAQSAA
jgi:transposase